MTFSSDTAAPTGMLKYALLFGLMMLFCQVVVAVLTTVLRFETPAAMGIIVIMASLAFVMQKFVTDTRRAPLSSERLSLATLGAVVAVVVTAALQALSALLLDLAGEHDALKDVIRELTVGNASPTLTFAVLAALVFALTFVIIFASAGFLARGALKRLNTRK
ncbi:ABZJ_00895 family protein [Mesorhizobium sp. NPDC059025]|uniref:ABZJ_00895 family protein n=1 Tax=unclassified Mesorhizobium TaxID=325217 RepID=UPI0036887703